MKIKIAWTIQSFFLCFLFNLAFAAVIFFMADRVLEALNEWVSPFAGSGGPDLPEDVRVGLAGLGSFVVQIRGYMMSVLAVLASAFTLLMWFFLFLAGRRQIGRAAKQAGSRPEPETAYHLPTAQGISEGQKERSEEGEEAR
jgi:hypothetical protein